MADIKQNIQLLKESVEARGREVAPASPDEFSKKIFAHINRTRRLLEAENVPDRLKQRYLDKWNLFVLSAKPGTFERERERTLEEVEKIYAEMESAGKGVEEVLEEKKEQEKEAVRKFEEAQEAAEAIKCPEFVLGEDTFNLGTPHGVVSGFNALSVMEDQFVQTSTGLNTAFEETKVKLDEAVVAAQEAGKID